MTAADSARRNERREHSTSYWESAYRSGHTPWDPGPYDGHIPNILNELSIPPGRVLDVGCGNGVTLIWLAKRGFECCGVDMAPTAIEIARKKAGKEGVSCTWIVGAFPDQVGTGDLQKEYFDFVMERGFLHLNTAKRDHDRILRGVLKVLKPGGLFYSLIAKREGATWFGGPPKWREEEVRDAVSPHFEIVKMGADVFTPGEVGSMPAWVCVFRKPQQGETHRRL